MPSPSTSETSVLRLLRGLLLTLVFLLTFEGLARKLAIPGTSVVIFLLKDVFTLFIGILVLQVRRPPALDFLWGAYFMTILLFMPAILVTLFHDPILAVFGAKEYLLYPVVGLAVFTAFENASVDEIYRFFRWMALLIIPTVYMSLLQLQLSPTHWLNLSVGGDDLQGFSAGGHLRVSSTFSFVAQYCIFLNAEMFITMVALSRPGNMQFVWRWICFTLIPLLIVSCYVTGSRGAVVGNTVIILIACALTLIKFEARNAFRIITLIAVILLTILIVQYFFPHLFAAYSEREKGKLVGVSGEIQQRVFDSFFGWTYGAFSTPFFGHGLGIMSNGSDLISNYASNYRAMGQWTETDFSTTLFEGGLYLVFIWYGFRYYIIYQTTQRFLANIRGEFTTPAAFCQAFVILIGLTGTLAIQPPVAIWWWLSVGTSQLLWWKCVEPKQNEENPTTLAPTAKKKIRGRSAYAERLHRKR